MEVWQMIVLAASLGFICGALLTLYVRWYIEFFSSDDEIDL
jgi:Na+-driven multidrug efflux pump